MSFGENMGADALIDELVRLAAFVRDAYDGGDMEQAITDANDLMRGATELSLKLVEEKVDK